MLIQLAGVKALRTGPVPSVPGAGSVTEAQALAWINSIAELHDDMCSPSRPAVTGSDSDSSATGSHWDDDPEENLLTVASDKAAGGGGGASSSAATPVRLGRDVERLRSDIACIAAASPCVSPASTLAGANSSRKFSEVPAQLRGSVGMDEANSKERAGGVQSQMKTSNQSKMLVTYVHNALLFKLRSLLTLPATMSESLVMEHIVGWHDKYRLPVDGSTGTQLFTLSNVLPSREYASQSTEMMRKLSSSYTLVW